MPGRTRAAAFTEQPDQTSHGRVLAGKGKAVYQGGRCKVVRGLLVGTAGRQKQGQQNGAALRHVGARWLPGGIGCGGVGRLWQQGRNKTLP